MLIATKGHVLVAHGYVRVVHGSRGDYVEFTKDQIILSGMHQVLENTHEKNKFYDEYRTRDGVKVYLQFGYVGYAKYKPNMWYISPEDLDFVFPHAPTKLESFFNEDNNHE